MKIQLASDLHLEFLQDRHPGERLIKPHPDADVLVLAGDIAVGTQACQLFANWASERGMPIIYVAGNHEFYGQILDPALEKLRAAAKDCGIQFLEQDSFVIDGVRFLGATMWTDYRLYSVNRTQTQQMDYCNGGLSDHFVISVGPHIRFTAYEALGRHERSRKWLETELAKPFDGKTVVVTHHGPHPLSIHPRFAGSALNAGFVSDLSDLMPGVDLWLHGHVHDSFDYQVGQCRVVANPAGYSALWNGEHDMIRLENKSFVSTLLLTI